MDERESDRRRGTRPGTSGKWVVAAVIGLAIVLGLVGLRYRVQRQQPAGPADRAGGPTTTTAPSTSESRE